MTGPEPWNDDVRGEQALRLINSNAPTIRVAAGPGTGKTRTLVRRVQRVVHPRGLHAAGREVLIVAFNRVIAADLAKDVGARLDGLPEECFPIVRTVHGLCLEAIGTPLRLLLPHEREAMIYDLLHLFPDLRDTYRRHKIADQALRDYEAHQRDHVALWQAAQRWLARHRAVLISDLPHLLLDKIRGGDYAGQRYEHVIVDEFQDLTPGEQLLFVKLRRPGGFLTALGDPNQSIYRFRGNDREGLQKLEQLEPAVPVTDIPLPDCYRCPRNIVELANRLMALYPPPLGIANDTTAHIHVVWWRTPSQESRGLARHIVANIRAHPDDRHLAMVTRKDFGYDLRDEIKALAPDLTVDLNFSESLLEQWPVREAFLFFCLIVDDDAPTWRSWFGYQDPDGEEGCMAPKRNADAYLKFLDGQKDHITWEAVRAMADGPVTAVKGIGGSTVWARAKRLVELKAAFGLDPLPGRATEVVEAIFDGGRWPGGDEDRAAIDFESLRTKALEIVGGARQDATDVILRRLARRLRHLIATREPFEASGVPGLQVTTLWGAKGITADHVYVVGLCDAALPGTKRPEYPGTDDEFIEEQRRLFYVTLTRSRKTLVLSRAKVIRPGDAFDLGLGVLPLFNKRWAQLEMSAFLRDVLPLLPEAVSGATWQGCGR